MKRECENSGCEEKTPVHAGSKLPPKLRELQGSFSLSGFFISDERVLQYEAEFQEMKKRGEVEKTIQKVIRKIRDT